MFALINSKHRVLFCTSLFSHKAMANHYFIILGLLAYTCSVVLAFEPCPLQDFCIADSTNSALVNGRVGECPKLTQAHDSFLTEIHFPGNTLNSQGSKVTPVNIAHTRTQTRWHLLACVATHRGVSAHHIFTLDPSTPRASKILTVLEGTLYVGFVTSNPKIHLTTNVLQKGDMLVYPIGLIHFQFNIGYTNGRMPIAIAASSNKNPGVITIANAMFGSNLSIGSEVLTKAFQVDKNTVDNLQAQF